MIEDNKNLIVEFIELINNDTINPLYSDFQRFMGEHNEAEVGAILDSCYRNTVDFDSAVKIEDHRFRTDKESYFLKYLSESIPKCEFDLIKVSLDKEKIDCDSIMLNYNVYWCNHSYLFKIYNSPYTNVIYIADIFNSMGESIIEKITNQYKGKGGKWQ